MSVAAAIGAVAVSATAAGGLTGSPCTAGSGVTVVADFTHWGGGIRRGCAAGRPDTALDALHAAGFSTAGTAQYGDAFVCRVGNLPSVAEQSCVSTPPANAFWALYYAVSTDAGWSYSALGALELPSPGGEHRGLGVRSQGRSRPFTRERCRRAAASDHRASRSADDGSAPGRHPARHHGDPTTVGRHRPDACHAFGTGRTECRLGPCAADDGGRRDAHGPEQWTLGGECRTQHHDDRVTRGRSGLLEWRRAGRRAESRARAERQAVTARRSPGRSGWSARPGSSSWPWRSGAGEPSSPANRTASRSGDAGVDGSST